MKKILSTAVAAIIAITMYGQQITGDMLKTQMIKDWERAKAYTNEYLNTMPADKYSFKAQDSIRSFAQQMLHLASGNVGLSAAALGKDRLWVGRQLEGTASARTKDSVVYFVNASYDFVIDGIKNLDPAKFGEPAKTFNQENPRWVWLLKTFEHQTHHRGQTTIYIRLVGVKPPNERLF